jgi:thiopurine S-methyltransferase
MEPQFWIKAWNEGRTAFHQGQVHARLAEFYPQLNPKEGGRVLVPLCGKSKDLLWLRDRGLQVQGVELHETAVQAFFEENGLSPVQVARDGDFTHYRHGTITISCGDFFRFSAPAPFDVVYDRAALVALAAPMRETYARAITTLLACGGKAFLIVYEYEQSRMEGPPFSVGPEELRRLYGDRFTMKLVASGRPTNESPRLAALEALVRREFLSFRLDRVKLPDEPQRDTGALWVRVASFPKNTAGSDTSIRFRSEIRLQIGRCTRSRHPRGSCP